MLTLYKSGLRSNDIMSKKEQTLQVSKIKNKIKKTKKQKNSKKEK